ncbi:MAG: hypothetical protein NW201_14385 [Gemmatimonadales bacterium]|nr:hypothetical protein [Gemmatimonadales bacterium]
MPVRPSAPRLAALLVPLVTVATALSAQAHPLVGKWAVEYEGGVQISNGERTTFRLKAELVVEAEGDSLIATMRTEPPMGMSARPPTRMSAVRAAGPARFLRKSIAAVNTNGDERSMEVVSRWTLEARGDDLTGQFEVVNGGPDGDTSPRTVKGKRVG